MSGRGWLGLGELLWAWVAWVVVGLELPVAVIHRHSVVHTTRPCLS